jgi:glycine/D-amino acid oxidase-like deaminating enzyme
MNGGEDHRGGEGHCRQPPMESVTGVDWEAGGETGTIAADIVINCGGMWGRDLAAQSGVTLPLHACEHFYLVTEPIEGLPATCRCSGCRTNAPITRKTPAR